MKTTLKSLTKEINSPTDLKPWKAFLSSLIIISMLWTDVATAMMKKKGNGEPNGHHKGVVVKQREGGENGHLTHGTSNGHSVLKNGTSNGHSNGHSNGTSNGHSSPKLSLLSTAFVEEKEDVVGSSVSQKRLSQEKSEQEEQARYWQKALEVLSLQKEDLGRREEELKREGKRIHEDLEEIKLLKQQLLEERQQQEKVEHKWKEERQREEEQRVQKEEEHQRLFKETRQKREEEARLYQQEFERKVEEFEFQRQRLLKEEALTKESLKNMQQQKVELAEQARLLKEEKVQLNNPISSETEGKKDPTPSIENEERPRQIALEEKQIQSRQEELEETKSRALESLEDARKQQNLLLETQRREEKAFQEWQEKQRLVETQILKEEEERLRLVEKSRIEQEEEAKQTQREFEKNKEALHLKEQQLREKESLSQEALEKLQLQQKELKHDQEKWTEAECQAQEKLEACRLKIERLRKEAIYLGKQKERKISSSSDTEEMDSPPSSDRPRTSSLSPSTSPEDNSPSKLKLVPIVQSNGPLLSNGHDRRLVKKKKKHSPPSPTERTGLLEWQQENDLVLSKGSIQHKEGENDRSLDDFSKVVVIPAPKQKRDNEPLLVGEDDEILPVYPRDMEEGRGRDPRDFFTHLQILSPREDLDRRVLAFLTYAKKHIIDGKFTLRQGLLGGVGGTLIGAGVGNAMPPIFSGGIVQISSEATWSNTEANLFIAHTAITLGIDSISRNAMIIGDLAGPSTEEFSIPVLKLKYRKVQVDPRKGALILVYLGAGLAALLPVYYLWSVEEDDLKYDKQHNAGQNRDKYLTFFWCLAPTLWLDSLFTNGRAAKEWVDEKFKNSAIRRAFSDQFSPESGLRQQELKRFKDLERLFKYAPNEDIDEFYEQVLVNGFKIKKNGVHIPDETIQAKDALRTLKVLRGIHADSQLPGEVKETWKHVISEICGWGIPIAATVGRSLVFYTIISHLLGDMGLVNKAANTTLSVIFGGLIASFFQGKVEKDSVKAGVYELLNGEETEGDASHNCLRSGLRKVGKGYNYLQGAWNTLPYILVGVAATSGWPVAWQVVTLLFFGVADMFNNTMSFHESYGGVFNGAESLLSYGYATTSYKRNKLIRLVRRYRLAYETMAPGVLMKVDALLSEEKSGLLDYSEENVPFRFTLKRKKKKDTEEHSKSSEEYLAD